MGSFQKTFQVGGCFIYGRADDFYGIAKLISSEDRTNIDSGVVSVIADRGTGRTTMLHLLHNELCSDFDITKYICMPENFDEKGIMRLIVESLISSRCDITDLEVLKEIVKEEVIDQRLLLLLDDFENKSQKCWDLLFALLKICKEESAVVITATRETVAKVKGPMQFYYMNNLSKEWCWMIFKQGVFGQNPDADTELADIGKCVVAKCRNVTLCIKVLSGALRHSIAADRWRAVLDDNFWEMDEVDGGLLPALRVCYEYLPFHLKQCFKFCSLFPKEYIFSRNHLVRMWLSQGFIEPSEGRELEEIGLEYFDQLLSRSFFQDSVIPDMIGDKFVMPWLIHDLAQQLSMNECFQFEESVERAPEHACHLALAPLEFQSISLSHLITRVRNLQTFLVVSRSEFQYQSVSSSILKLDGLQDLFTKFRKLITLDLSNTDVEELPESLGSLQNLHYLGLSSTKIAQIPLEISNLVHLQTLEAKSCHYLEELPRTIETLTNLRYLDVTKENGYVVMPHGIGMLSNLRNLSTFNVGMDLLLQCGIEELKDMKHLRGCLEISGLVNVRSKIDAKKADVRSKEHIETLSFQWSDGMSFLKGEERSEIAEEVLESLRPTQNLREIIVRDYPGNSFPTWIECATFSRLVSITFDHCYNCERLPSLGRLPLLRILSVQKMYCVQRMSLSGSEYFSENIVRYPSLEQLTICEMYELVEWTEIGNRHFPILHSLCINRCPLLRNVPKFPALVELSVYSCSQFLEAMDLPSLQSLRIEGLLKTRSFILPKHLFGLKRLEISHCPEPLSLKGLSLLNSLEKIIISRCPQLDSLDSLDEILFAYEDRGNTSVWLRKKKIASCGKLDVSGSGLFDEQQEHPNSSRKRKDRADLSSLSSTLAEGHKKIKELQSPMCKQDQELIETARQRLANPVTGIKTPEISAVRSAMVDSNVPQTLHAEPSSSVGFFTQPSTVNDNNKNMNHLLNLLADGKEEIARLSFQLNGPQHASAIHVQNIFSQVVTIMSSIELVRMKQLPSHGHHEGFGLPGRSGSGYPRRLERMTRKRENVVKRTVQVPATTPNSEPDDGYSWRKYGQKVIFNTKHPRSYYRCTFQKSQNCQALKHVQRSDEDPEILFVTYQGEHTCTQHAGQTSLAQPLDHQLLIPTQNEFDKQCMIEFDNPYPAIETHESCQGEQGKIHSPSSSSAQAGLRSENPNVFSPS